MFKDFQLYFQWEDGGGPEKDQNFCFLIGANSYHVTLLFAYYRSGPSTMVTISDSCPIHTKLGQNEG